MSSCPLPSVYAGVWRTSIGITVGLWMALACSVYSALAWSHSDTLPYQDFAVDDTGMPEWRVPHKPHRVDVFFSYACPWCYQVDTVLQALESSAAVDVRYIPVFFKPGWDNLARAYYTAESLGLQRALHPVFFARVQTQQCDYHRVEEIEKIFVEHGVTAEVFRTHFNSSAVAEKMARSELGMAHYAVFTVPSLVVDGKFKTSLPQNGGDPKRLLAVLQELTGAVS